MTPIATVTPRLEEEFRYDQFWEHIWATAPTPAEFRPRQGPGADPDNQQRSHLINLPPTRADGRKAASGFGDWPFLTVKQRFFQRQRAGRELSSPDSSACRPTWRRGLLQRRLGGPARRPWSPAGLGRFRHPGDRRRSAPAQSRKHHRHLDRHRRGAAIPPGPVLLAGDRGQHDLRPMACAAAQDSGLHHARTGAWGGFQIIGRVKAIIPALATSSRSLNAGQRRPHDADLPTRLGADRAHGLLGVAQEGAGS